MKWLTICAGLALAVPAAAETTQWVGVYSCAQGATAMKLTVIDDVPTRVTAIFAFGPTPANPGVPRGSFALRGERAGARLTLEPVDWLERPAAYEMVGLRGVIAGDRLEGDILNSTCAAFALRRVASPSRQGP